MSTIPWVVLESISKETYYLLGFGVGCVLNEWWTLQSVVSQGQGLIITHFYKIEGEWKWAAEA